MATFYYLADSPRDSWDAVQVAHPVLPSQRSGRLGNQLYASLESTGSDPAVPLSSRCATFPLEASVDISPLRGYPRLQVGVPGGPWHSLPPTGHQRGFHASGNEVFQPRDWELGVPEPNIQGPLLEQSEIPSRHQGQGTWLDEQQSWLDWADISFPQAGQTPSEDSGHEVNLDVALSSADDAILNLDSTAYADHMDRARWGSDPAFAASAFTPPADQLSEREVSSIWTEYVMTSLKPAVNLLGTNIPANQLLIVGNNSHDLDFDDAGPQDTAAGRIFPGFFSGSNRHKHIDGLTSRPPIAQKVPPRPFRAGRKRPMPPRMERRWGSSS